MSAVSFEQYVQITATNWSRLKHLRESPLKYRFLQGGDDEDTVYRAMGRAVHALVFEPDVFRRDYAIYEGGDRRWKDWTAFKDAHDGQTIFKPNEIEHITGMANAVRTNPIVAPYLTDGEFEKTVAWTDPESGERCKARIDWLTSQALLDLKTTTTIDAIRFGRIAARLGYHCQVGGHYYNAVRYGLQRTLEEVAIVAVESSPPYDVAMFVLDDDAIYAAQEEVAQLIQRLQRCRESGEWPGRYPEKQALILPPWIYDEDEDESAGAFGLSFGKAA